MYKCDNCHYKLPIYLLIYSDRLYEFHLWSVACESQPNIVMVWLLKDNSMFGITVKDWFALSDYVLGCNLYHYCIKIKNTETCCALQQLVDWITSHTVQNSMLPVKYGRLRCLNIFNKWQRQPVSCFQGFVECFKWFLSEFRAFSFFPPLVASFLPVVVQCWVWEQSWTAG